MGYYVLRTRECPRIKRQLKECFAEVMYLVFPMYWHTCTIFSSLKAMQSRSMNVGE